MSWGAAQPGDQHTAACPGVRAAVGVGQTLSYMTIIPAATARPAWSQHITEHHTLYYMHCTQLCHHTPAATAWPAWSQHTTQHHTSHTAHSCVTTYQLPQHGQHGHWHGHVWCCDAQRMVLLLQVCRG
eukprot:1157958-Pelagomonas_calceolata.AAC.5